MDVDLETVLARIQADRAEAEAQLRVIQGRLDELTSMEAGVQVAVSASRKYAPAALQATHHEDRTPTQERRWATLTNMDAAVAALAEIGRPASTREVYEKLRSAGRPEDFEQVRAAFGYLKRKKKIERASAGLWQPPMVTGTRDADVPAPVTEPQATAPAGRPMGSTAAKQILQSDPDRAWTVREVWDEEVKRGWAKPSGESRDAVRIALKRLRDRDPRVQTASDGLAYTYRWRIESPAGELALSNGSGVSHGGEATA